MSRGHYRWFWREMAYRSYSERVRNIVATFTGRRELCSWRGLILPLDHCLVNGQNPKTRQYVLQHHLSHSTLTNQQLTATSAHIQRTEGSIDLLLQNVSPWLSFYLSWQLMPAHRSKREPTKEEIGQHFQSLRRQQQQLAAKIQELALDKQEHEYVAEPASTILFSMLGVLRTNQTHPVIPRAVEDTLKRVEKDRKCYRLVGGVLVDRSVTEVLPALSTNREQVLIVPPDLAWNPLPLTLTSLRLACSSSNWNHSSNQRALRLRNLWKHMILSFSKG